MSRRGNCWDNAVVESFFNLLKRERIRRRKYKTREEARRDVFDYIEFFYNPQRKHARNGMLSPIAFEQQQKLKLQGVYQTRGYSLLHVVAHEIGHAFLREFDLPILGPEEAIADDFATVYVYFIFPDRAADIVAARAAQNLADRERSDPFSEYLDDEKRAGRSVCLLYGLDPERYAAFPSRFNIPDDDAAACRDFAPEVARGWRLQLATRTMPENARVTEVHLRADDLPLTEFLSESTFRDDLYTLLARIDWHSTITLSFEECDGSAEWSRNDRTIRVCDTYVARFEAQLNP